MLKNILWAGMMKNKHIEKKIDSLIARRNNMITILSLLTGGIVGLSFSFTNPLSLAYIIIGLIALWTFLKGVLNTEDHINYLIERMKKDEL